MRHFGFDLDNTLIDYSQSCVQYTEQENLPVCTNVKNLRKMLKPGDADTSQWTRAQSWIYGEGLKYAIVESEAILFLKSLVNKGWQISIHSHKTQFGPLVFGRVPLRKLMTDWINNSILSTYFTIHSNVNFYDDLDSKVRGIASSNLNCYVDDLYRVFEHPNYPRHVKSYLYQDFHQDLDWLIEIDSFQDIHID